MLGTYPLGSAPYGSLFRTAYIIVVSDSGSGVESLSINALLIIDETGSGLDVVSGGTDKRVADFGAGIENVNIVAVIHITDTAQAEELLGGRRWVFQQVSENIWIAKPASGTWIEKTKSSNIWNEKDEIE